jgi:flagellar biosynthesis protein FlhF
MPDALDLVREELGRDALLLNTRMCRHGKGRQVEVTAAIDALARPKQSEEADIDRQAWSAVGRELECAHLRIRGLESGDPCARWLADCDFTPDLARSLQESARGHADLPATVSAELVARIQVVHGLLPLPDQPRRIALIGPPGAGKTTALVKIAAQACAGGRADLALVNLDSYRPGAEDYLGQVGDTLRVPVLSERSPDVQRGLPDVEGLLLIDTDSRIFAADPGAAALRNTLSQLRPDVTALVLPASWRTADLVLMLGRYLACRPTHLIFSGLDLTIRYGGILSIAATAGLPVASVLTTGRFDAGMRVFQPELLLQQMMTLYPAGQARKDESLG